MGFLQSKSEQMSSPCRLPKRDHLQDKNALIAPPTPTAAAIRNNQSINVFLYVATAVVPATAVSTFRSRSSKD